MQRGFLKAVLQLTVFLYITTSLWPRNVCVTAPRTELYPSWRKAGCLVGGLVGSAFVGCYLKLRRERNHDAISSLLATTTTITDLESRRLSCQRPRHAARRSIAKESAVPAQTSVMRGERERERGAKREKAGAQSAEASHSFRPSL